jgi:hypothetical protein
MEDKYYKPELSEFVDGFEFESAVTDSEKYITIIYAVGHDACFNKHIDYPIDKVTYSVPDHIRVKYLDREDIEECNWIYAGKGVDIWFGRKGKFEMSSWTAYDLIMHYGLHDHRLHIYAEDPGSPDYTLFRGIVRNKSEFLKVMKMLQIEK